MTSYILIVTHVSLSILFLRLGYLHGWAWGFILCYQIHAMLATVNVAILVIKGDDT